MADVTERTLALLAELQTGRPFPGDELAARLRVSPRTLRRDVDRLRGYGYPVETQPGPGGYYRLASGRAMPPLLLDDDEAVATLLGLALLGSAASASPPPDTFEDAAARAYAKVDQYLPARLRPHAAAVRASLEAGPTLAPATSAGTVGTLATAIHHHQVVTFDYRGATRRVEPHRQIHRAMRWYLLAWDTDRTDWRVFRTDRVTGLDRLTTTFTPRPLPADSGTDYLLRGFDRLRDRVVLTIDAPPAAVADALRHHDVELTPAPDSGTRAVIRLDSWQWLVLGLAFLDADFTVEEPVAVREALERFGRRLSR
ncbi:YafY family protein [Virgisporangium ochraceum]|uniref:DeoR family transcriptional regulator n=1 Tax=Virgisporangium ochraceum TaxID=65505 RepID=A0A8J3ZT26_9ACTN|nr:WYL domain-containing protein [Virgisporangium ochraceum]GIJ68538.1 DeoR family transcriptional regulator [Virgisporangium ochraceum]